MYSLLERRTRYKVQGMHPCILVEGREYTREIILRESKKPIVSLRASWRYKYTGTSIHITRPELPNRSLSLAPGRAGLDKSTDFLIECLSKKWLLRPKP
jgi:hypothetical protein